MSGDDDNEWLVERIGQKAPAGSATGARVARYRRHAADIRAKVENVKDRTARQMLLDVARQYDDLATSIERLLSSRRGD